MRDMPPTPNKPSKRAQTPDGTGRLLSAGRKGRRVVRALAQSTLLAAGIAATHIGIAEIDSRFDLFNPNLVDRLEVPISRYHE